MTRDRNFSVAFFGCTVLKFHSRFNKVIHYSCNKLAKEIGGLDWIGLLVDFFRYLEVWSLLCFKLVP